VIPSSKKKQFTARLQLETIQKINILSKKLTKISKQKISQADIIQLAIELIEKEDVKALFKTYVEKFI
jgi:predicted DNA-binding protein